MKIYKFKKIILLIPYSRNFKSILKFHINLEYLTKFIFKTCVYIDFLKKI